MSKARKGLFTIGILLIIVLSAIGTYFGLVALGFFEKDVVEISYTVNVEKLTIDNETIYGGNYIRSGNLKEGHYEVVDFQIDENDNFVPSIKIFNKYAEDVSKEYDIGLVSKSRDVEKIKLELETVESPVYLGQDRTLYNDWVKLKEGYFLYNASVLTEVFYFSDVYDIDVQMLNVFVRFLTDNNVRIDDYFEIGNNLYKVDFLDRIVYLDLHYDEMNEIMQYVITEGSLANGETITVEYYPFDHSYSIIVLDQKGVDRSEFYNFIVTIR